MSAFIGKTISLISNSDIRYLGILHEINSEESTVSLMKVRTFGTEGRAGGANEIPASDAVYDYVVFRGSDVKDLKIAVSMDENGASDVDNVDTSPNLKNNTMMKHLDVNFFT